MVLLSAIIMSIVLSFSDDMIHSASKDTLESVVRTNANELEYDDRALDLDDITFYQDGVYVILYSEDGVLVSGDYPNGFTLEVELAAGDIIEVTDDETGTQYYIYDYLSSVDDSSAMMWVRGVMVVDDLTNYLQTIVRITLLILPIFILLTAVGCYLIAQKTFRPLDQIVATAENIRHSEDLSLRIDLQQGSKEMLRLSQTFDGLFERLEQAFLMEKQFSQNVSHELRTPTAVILAQCEYALSACADSEDKQEALEVVQKQANKISKLTGELLQLVRMDQGIDKVEMAPVDLSELVALVCEEQETILPDGMSIQTAIQPRVVIDGNQTMLIRLLTNLVNNGVRYGKVDGVLRVSLTEVNQQVSLTVQDQGIGMDPQHLDLIFNRFYRVDSARTADDTASTGLGLSMVAEIAKLHGAQVGVQSTKGQGSTFTITFVKKI